MHRRDCLTGVGDGWNQCEERGPGTGRICAPGPANGGEPSGPSVTGKQMVTHVMRSPAPRSRWNSREGRSGPPQGGTVRPDRVPLPVRCHAFSAARISESVNQAAVSIPNSASVFARRASTTSPRTAAARTGRKNNGRTAGLRAGKPAAARLSLEKVRAADVRSIDNLPSGSPIDPNPQIPFPVMTVLNDGMSYATDITECVKSIIVQCRTGSKHQ